MEIMPKTTYGNVISFAKQSHTLLCK